MRMLIGVKNVLNLVLVVIGMWGAKISNVICAQRGIF